MCIAGCLGFVTVSDIHCNALTPITVVVTLGPSCRSVEVLTALLEAGMACARIDLTVCMSVYTGMS